MTEELPAVEAGDDIKRMRLRYAGVCHRCGERLPQRTEALYFKHLKKVSCLECPTSTDDSETEPSPQSAVTLDRGRPGVGAHNEYARRRARDEARTRKKWGAFGGIAVALTAEKQSTTAWAIGAEGERRVGARLNAVAERLGGIALHDRKIPGSRANIDHILIVPSGVWVIDSKRYTGKVEIRRSGGLLTPLVERLTVRGRNCTSLVEQSLRQVDLVRSAVPTVPVTGMLCFQGAEWPLGGHPKIRGIHVLWPRRVKRVVEARTRNRIDVGEAAHRLAMHFPAAQ